MGKYFGTDGFRGEANKELTAAKAFKVGRYIGWYYGKQRRPGRYRNRKRYEAQLLYAGVRAFRRDHFFRFGCLSAPCNYDAFRILLLPDRRI